ncbi:MAG: hypothetical protein J6W29_02120 [Neisseriaceae bacterium]|nr:hypothetical protein [Neisseriaceae bacterium]
MDNLVNILLGIAVMGLCYVGIKNAEHINELKQEIQSLKENEVADEYNSKFITPQRNEPIKIGKVGNRVFFLANLDGRECISVIGLNMGSYVICGNEQPQTTQ